MLGKGQFGMAEETAALNDVIARGVAQGKGIGQSVCAHLASVAPPFAHVSLLASAAPFGGSSHRARRHRHRHHPHAPRASGEAIGAGSLRDFRYFTSSVAKLAGGVYLNCGSAVMLPEVFLKAVSLVRNRGLSLDGLTTVNLDFVRLYRPETNVVRRPVAGIGKGYSITGHHEIVLPLLAAAVRCASAK